MDKKSISVYVLIAVNTSFLSIWWGYQLGLSTYGLFAKYRFSFPTGAIGGSLISSMMAKCSGRLTLFTLCSVVGLLACVVVRDRQEAVSLEYELDTLSIMGMFVSGIIAGIISSYVPIYCSV